MNDEMPRADDIPWSLPPLPRLELLPADALLALDPGELLTYAYDLQRALLAVREVLHVSLGTIVRLTNQRDRALDQIRSRRAGETRPPS